MKLNVVGRTSSELAEIAKVTAWCCRSSVSRQAVRSLAAGLASCARGPAALAEGSTSSSPPQAVAALPPSMASHRVELFVAAWASPEFQVCFLLEASLAEDLFWASMVN